MKYYEVQTFYGSHRKYFNHKWNAKKYKEKLAKQLDLEENLIEICQFEDEPTEVIVTED